jgi:hypothetical protein
MTTYMCGGHCSGWMVKVMAAQNGCNPGADMAARTVQLVMEQVYPVLGVATVEAVLRAAIKTAAQRYPFLDRLSQLTLASEIPAHLCRYFPDIAPDELLAAMDALLQECIAAVRELTGDIMLGPISEEISWRLDQAKQEDKLY